MPTELIPAEPRVHPVKATVPATPVRLLDGVSRKPNGGAAELGICCSANGRPAIVKVLVRRLVDEFAAKE
jgi:hypothetical protein